MFVKYFFIKVEINLLNDVNLTDCFTSTLTLALECCLSDGSILELSDADIVFCVCLGL